MENQRSRFARPVTAMQLAMIIWLPIILAGLGWVVVTSYQSSQRQADDRNKATAKAMVDSARACRQLRKDLAAMPVAPGDKPIELPKCD